jgi:site-specific DNA-methyltransferase (adenine-specific)
MRYLIKLVTPANGIVLDPFTGSGSTGKAALLDGYQFIGIELTEEYLPIIEGRLKWALNKVSEDKEKQELQKKEALF